MKFEVKGEPVKLVGDSILVKSQILLKAMLRNLRKQGEGYWIECSRMEANKEVSETKEIPKFLAQVLEKNAQVFDEPVGLLPIRNQEHAIILKEGSNPVGVRPYRYPQSPKDEIKRMIEERLAAGIIKPSYSPYSSPVLLVKKKNGL